MVTKNDESRLNATTKDINELRKGSIFNRNFITGIYFGNGCDYGRACRELVKKQGDVLGLEAKDFIIVKEEKSLMTNEEAAIILKRLVGGYVCHCGRGTGNTEVLMALGKAVLALQKKGDSTND